MAGAFLCQDFIHTISMVTVSYKQICDKYNTHMLGQLIKINY